MKCVKKSCDTHKLKNDFQQMTIDSKLASYYGNTFRITGPLRGEPGHCSTVE